LHKDLRTWVSSHGGVYVPPTKRTPPNPSLKHIQARDIVSLHGKKLTLMNPAYVVSQIMRESIGLHGAKGHITSLKLLNPQNNPDSWEIKQLKLFQTGVKEVYEIVTVKGEKSLRMMEPLITKKSCLKCHGYQNYKVGDIRGGVSVYVPMENFRKHEHEVFETILFSYGFLWLLGFLFISVFINKLQKIMVQRAEINKISETNELLKLHHEQLEASNKELTKALNEIKTLRGIIPICSYCKKIRNDEGAWDILEAYICDNSNAQFSHGICPDCFEKQFKGIKKK